MKNSMIKKVISSILILAISVSTAACSEKADAPEEVSSTERAAAVSNGELKEDSTVIGVGNTKVSYNEYRIYSWFLKNQYEDVMSEQVWDYNLGEKTVGQTAIEDILRLIIQIKVMNKEAVVQGIGLGVDEKEGTDHKADQYFVTIPPEVQQANGITAEGMHQIFEENEVARKMYDVVTGNVEANIDEASMQAAKVLLIHFPADDSNREEVRAKMNALAAEQKTYAGNFYSFAEEKTGAPPQEVIIGKMDSRSALVNTVLTMEKYTVSSVVEEQDGFYLMYCLKKNTKGLNKAYREQFITEQQNKTFQAAYENWAEKYEVKVSKSLLAN